MLKFWPYIRKELDYVPNFPIIFYHFSDWKSYGSYWDLWKWTYSLIEDDKNIGVDFKAQQFDTGGSDKKLRNENIQAALDWVIFN